VAHAGQGDAHQAIEELPHPHAAQGDHRPDRLPFSDLELRDRFLRPPRHRLLAGDARELVGAGIDDLRVGRRFAEAHVHDDLLKLGHGHHVLVAELLGQRRDHFLLVFLFEPARHLSTTPSHLRHTRTLRPSPRILWPTRVWALHSGQTSCTFDACSDASRSTMPPLMPLPGFGFVWRLIMFTPSTIKRSVPVFDGTTFRMRPRLPRSLPVMTSTLSFLCSDVVERGINNLEPIPHSTSGASEMIFMNRRSRSSRATGPNTRVPIGSLLSLIRTAAFRSKRMWVPSRRSRYFT